MQGKCPAVPVEPLSTYTEGDNIYMSYANTTQLSKQDIQPCDIMVLDTKNDTFSEAKNIPNRVFYELQLLSNQSLITGNGGLKYGEHYILPDYSDDTMQTYTIYNSNRGFKKIKTFKAPREPNQEIPTSPTAILKQEGNMVYYLGLPENTPGVLSLHKTNITQ